MKRLASIFFLLVMLFNMFGYRVLSSLLEKNSDAALISSLDNQQYNHTDLISIKIPSNLPYYTNSPEFARMDGQVELNGQHYNYVKYRMFNDSVEYLCIPNRAKTRLSKARDEFYKLVNDLQHPSQNKKSGNDSRYNNLLTEYYQQTDAWTFSSYSTVKSITIAFHTFYLPAITLPPAELPPDVC